MMGLWRAAIFAALFPCLAAAQDVTLTSRDGALSIPGTLQGYDGEVYRIESPYGALTIDALSVVCDGPACPDLTAPKAVIRIVGDADAGKALVPNLLISFAASRGLVLNMTAGTEGPVTLTDPATQKILAEISFRPLAQQAARAELKSGRAELMLSSTTEPDLGNKALALDSLVPIVAPGNPIPGISTLDLAKALAGEIKNWAEIGGPDMPLVLHALQPDTAFQLALTARLGKESQPAETHATLAELSVAVAKDPWSLAITGRTATGAARVLPLSDSCGFPLLPNALAVKAEDYPLTLPLYVLTPRRRLPLMAREFLEFLALPSAQSAIAAAGYIDRRPERHPMTDDGLRLINAIQGAGDETTLADLKRLVDVMDGADRLSLTFRFKDGTSQMEPSSLENLADLARLLEVDAFRDTKVILAGFSDGSGAATANLQLSQLRAEAVLRALQDLAPTVKGADLPEIMAFGEALPMACDETAAGRRLNRRVELWLKPDFTPPPQP